MAVATKQLKQREKITKDNTRNSYLKRKIRFLSHATIVSENHFVILREFGVNAKF